MVPNEGMSVETLLIFTVFTIVPSLIPSFHSVKGCDSYSFLPLLTKILTQVRLHLIVYIQRSLTHFTFFRTGSVKYSNHVGTTVLVFFISSLLNFQIK